MQNHIQSLAVIFLLGFACIQISFAGDKVSPMTVDGAKSVTTEEAKKLFDDGVLFVDVRKDKDWNAGRVSDAIQLNVKTNFSEENLLKEMKKTEPAVIYCNGERCMRSSNATKKAVSWGFTNIYYYRDGFPAWKKAGYPVE
ncbi:rhodanese-like domain-containing protein [sulfur-oxidizing endosymbiont of Gigantopelta aegis]|uniref:rhodanese-like domain-containing protein n=1 Tax=sulfur-oxidizing endosymbiont of Gigantopelta aegis TaxID=2794934 RepID=UPI0018DB90CE|nr:rhodanese-like domain-containing protein [sulfur-oxidizing endosymbiont of Gigantopelta aegis]